MSSKHDLKTMLSQMTFGDLEAGRLAQATATARNASRLSAITETTSPHNADLATDIDTLLTFCSEQLTQWELDRCHEWHELLTTTTRSLSPKQEALVVKWVDKYVNAN